MSKFIYIFAKVTIKVNFAFNGLPNFFLFVGDSMGKQLNTSTCNAWSFVTSSCCFLKQWVRLFQGIITEGYKSLSVNGYSWMTEVESRNIYLLVLDQRH